MRRGGFVPQNFVIPPLHDNTSFMRLCIEGMSAAALGVALGDTQDLPSEDSEGVRHSLLPAQSLVVPATHLKRNAWSCGGAAPERSEPWARRASA